MGFNLLINSSRVFMECCFEENFKTASGRIRGVANKKEVMPAMSVRREGRESGSRHKRGIYHPLTNSMLGK